MLDECSAHIFACQPSVLGGHEPLCGCQKVNHSQACREPAMLSPVASCPKGLLKNKTVSQRLPNMLPGANSKELHSRTSVYLIVGCICKACGHA